MRNFLEKNASGRQALSTHCSSTAPIPRSLASVVSAVGAVREGWHSMVAEDKAALAAANASSTCGVHSMLSVFFLPAMAANRGDIVTLIFGMNLL